LVVQANDFLYTLKKETKNKRRKRHREGNDKTIGIYIERGLVEEQPRVLEFWKNQQWDTHIFSSPRIYSTVISRIVVSLGFLYLLRSREEHTTLTDDRAMQAPAAHGGNLIFSQGNKTPAATGIAITL